jgi:hypothetical protein
MTDWPVELRGVTESVVTTRGPNDRWNVAALGLRASNPVTARTWGRTRTQRNFEHEGEGYVQFTRDPLLFVDAALATRETDGPLLDEADAWVRVAVERIDSGTDGDTEWVEWTLEPAETGVEREVVPTIERGKNAVVEATVWASRLDVPAYDRAELAARLDFLGDVVRTCGGDREQEAWDRVEELVEW